jgi:hypothetical protein
MTREKMTYEEIEKVRHNMLDDLKKGNYALATVQAFVVYKAVHAYGEQETKEALK